MSIGPKELINLRASARSISSSIAALHVHPVDENGAFVSPGAGSTQVSVKEILTSSGASVMDSTNNAIGVTIRAGSAAGTEYTDGDIDASVSGGAILFDNSSNTLRSVTIARGLPVNIVAGSASSTEVLTRLADRDQSTQVANITNTTPASTAYALAIREVAPTTTVQVSSLAGAVIARSSAANFLASVYQSTAADLNVTVAGYVAPSTTVQVSSVGGAVVVRSSAANFLGTVYQSTAADLNVTVAGYSTTVNVSSLAGAVIVRSTAASLLASVYQSTAADLNVTVAGYSTTVNVSSLAGKVLTDQNSTVWVTQPRLFTSSGGGVEGSTTTQSTGGVLGLNVRSVQPSGRQSTSKLVRIDDAGGSTVMISSAAGLKHLVYAYAVTSTVIGPSSCTFNSSAVIERWGLILGSQSSGVTGANMALTPPGFIFGTDAANALNFVASATGLYRVSISWFTEA